MLSFNYAGNPSYDQDGRSQLVSQWGLNTCQGYLRYYTVTVCTKHDRPGHMPNKTIQRNRSAFPWLV